MRYTIADAYLRFYYALVEPNKEAIQAGKFIGNTMSTVPRNQLLVVQGFMFEHWSRQNAHFLAKIMRFDQVRYKSGAYFSRKDKKSSKGFQIDLIYIRDDRVVVICEIKHQEAPKISEISKKFAISEELFRREQPKYKNYTFRRVLITLCRLDPQISIDQIISLDDLFNMP